MVLYTICHGDTIQSVSQKVTGDASMWHEIADFNKLDYPFISNNLSGCEGRNVKTIGDTIKVPVKKADGDIVMYTNAVEEILGYDLLLTTDKTTLSHTTGGDLEAGLYGDIIPAVGVECLHQDLVHRLITPRGSLPYHPHYGSDLMNLIGQKKSVGWHQLVSVEIKSTLRCDPRVIDVTNLIIRDFLTGVHIECDILTEVSEFKLAYTM